MNPNALNELTYIVACLFAIGINIASIIALHPVSHTRVGFSLRSLAGLTMAWLIGYTVMILFDQVAQVLLITMYIVDYVMMTITFILFYFARAFTGCKGKWHWLLWLCPSLIYLLLYLPNLWSKGFVGYQLVWLEDFGFRLQGQQTPLGTAFLVLIYGFTFLSIISVIVGLLRVNPNFRRAAYMLSLMLFLPISISIGQTFLVFNRPFAYDYTPLLLAVCIFSLALFIKRTRITNLCLLSRDQFFDDFLNGVLVVDSHGFVLDGNRQAGEVFQSNIKYMLGKQIRDFFPLDEMNSSIQESAQTDKVKSFAWSNQLHREYEVFSHAFINNYQDVLGEVLTFQDVTEYNQLLYQTVQLSIRDSLTNAYNRRHFEALAAKQFAHARRYSMPFSILMLDMDHFKEINDTYGHIMGDQLLVKAVEIFQKDIRDADTVARYGGDEFVILLPNTGLPGAIQAAQRILKHCQETNIPIKEKDQKVNLSVSIGLAAWHHFLPKTEQALTYEELIQQADQALYYAKNAVHGSMAFYESGSCRMIPTSKSEP